MGLYISDHPLNEHRSTLTRLTTPIMGLRETTGAVKIGGIISSVKKITTKRNELMAFVRLEDTTGSIEVVVFPSIFQSSSNLWVDSQLVIVEGKSNVRDGEWKMLADKVWDLHEVASRLPPDPTIRLAIGLESTSQKDFEELHDILRSSPGDHPVELVVRKGGKEKPIPTDHKILLTPEVRQRLEARFGQCIMQ